MPSNTHQQNTEHASSIPSINRENKQSPQAILESIFGYSEFRGQQQSIIDTAIEGRDSLIIMPTGGGKSL
ncbi:MAG: hypothetical protein HOL40_08220, partial [Cellvibrionales bacterium]|nr:hypothetical protein [Cellvibrionales bacterium]